MNYYNENDRQAAAWLRELIKAGVIADGEVDERSILEVRPTDLRGFVQCHFFAGIGGWSYALRLAGWPDTRQVWTASLPCQPFSDAGLRLGEADERHLWPHFRELLRQCQKLELAPPALFGEQVASKAGKIWLARIRADLEALEHGVGSADLCAAGVTAPNIRQRLFWVAYARRDRFDLQCRESGESRSAGESEERHQPDDRREDGGLADAAGTSGPKHEREPRQGLRRPTRTRHAADRGGLGCGLDDALRGRWDAGTSEIQTTRDTAGRTDAGNAAEPGSHEQNYGLPRPPSPWDHFDLIPCRDDKARRVEAGTFPLDHGLPGRVGLLRGYGNAIVPLLATEFIQASEEAESLM